MPVQPNPLLAVGWFLQGVGSLFAVLGIPGFYSRAVARTGPVGVAGLAGVTLFLAYFGIFGCMLHALAVPDLIRQGATRPIPVDLGYLASALLVMIGSVALGIGALRARALPRAAAGLIIGGGVALFAGHPILHVEDIGLLLLVVGLGWAGYRLQAEPGTD